jgi:hypothetical protein
MGPCSGRSLAADWVLRDRTVRAAVDRLGDYDLWRASRPDEGSAGHDRRMIFGVYSA